MKSKRRAQPKKRDSYLDKVVDLWDAAGNWLFKGTRLECAQYSRETFAERFSGDVFS